MHIRVPNMLMSVTDVYATKPMFMMKTDVYMTVTDL